MIYGVGTDIVNIERIAHILKKIEMALSREC